MAQHRNLASVWEHLAGHSNISHTLREITGQHALQSALQEDEQWCVNGSIQQIIWIKTVFDLQRCYLSGTSAGASECPSNLTSCLLPPELLFTTILYLIDVKARSLSYAAALTASHLPIPSLILTQTVVSGLRLVLLRRDSLSLRHRRQLQSAIKEAWKDGHLQGIEHFIAQKIFPALLYSLNEPNRVDSHQIERIAARLPVYPTSMAPLSLQPETFVTPLVQAMSEEEDDFLDSYLVLFDALWAIECAITQQSLELQRHPGSVRSHHAESESDESIEHLAQKRMSLIVSIFHCTGPILPSTVLLESLAMTLLDWDEDLDHFLSRQDSLLQHRTSLRPTPSRPPNYGKTVSQSRPYFESAMTSFSKWLSVRRSLNRSSSAVAAGAMTHLAQGPVKEWVQRIASPNSKTASQRLDEPLLPVYIVNCPKLHAIPKKWLEEQLRWCDKFAYESIQKSPAIVKWKEEIQCPSCAPGGKIKCARFIEPVKSVQSSPRVPSREDYSSSYYSAEGSISYGPTWSSTESRSVSNGGTGGVSLPSHTTMLVTIPTSASYCGSEVERSRSADERVPQYTESPISPFTSVPVSRARSFPLSASGPLCPVSPLNESLNVPIPTGNESRSSFDLPIPVNTPSSSSSNFEKVLTSAPTKITARNGGSVPNTLTWNEESFTKTKSGSRGLRIASSLRRKAPGKEKETCVLPKEPVFAFSTSGYSLLLWGKHGTFVARFDLPINDAAAIQCCRYEADGIEAAVIGHRRCAVVAGTSLVRKLYVFNGVETTPAFSLDLDFSGRIVDMCIALSRDDKHVAVSINGQIELFNLENGLKRMALHHQMNVYELRGGISHRRAIPVTRMTSDESIPEELKAESSGWFHEQSKSLSSKEAAEEQQRQTAIITRKIYFSTDSQRLVVATQLADHCVYVDVWDVTREPVSTISEHSRSFKLPPWTLNDGDLTSVFYDSARRAALVTAFLGKEYPVLVPFPGYDNLQNETYSTKIVSAALSPSGSTFIVANGMTEIIQFTYTARSALAPHRLKKSSSKISAGMFKPSAIVLAMPQEDVLRAFWIKDGKCMLRNIKLGLTEALRDLDIRPYYDRLMSLKERPIIAQAPSLSIPELDSGEYI